MDVKRIEVFKGANALRYGANSIGGAVNFVTKTGYDAGPFEYWGEGGSYGFFKQHLATGQVHGPFDFYGGATVMGLIGLPPAQRSSIASASTRAADGTSGVG